MDSAAFDRDMSRPTTRDALAHAPRAGIGHLVARGTGSSGAPVAMNVREAVHRGGDTGAAGDSLPRHAEAPAR